LTAIRRASSFVSIFARGDRKKRLARLLGRRRLGIVLSAHR
jgi:hypothetical protein